MKRRIKRRLVEIFVGALCLFSQVLATIAAVPHGEVKDSIEVKAWGKPLTYLNLPGDTSAPFLTTPKGIASGEDEYKNQLAGLAVYCLEAPKDSPDGVSVSLKNKEPVSPAINYILSHGFKHGWDDSSTDMNPLYSMGNAAYDYYITQMAIHIVNPKEPYQLSDFTAVADRNPKVYEKIALLVNDALNKGNSEDYTLPLLVSPEKMEVQDWEVYVHEGVDGFLSKEYQIEGDFQNATWTISDADVIKIPSNVEKEDKNFRLWIPKEAAARNVGNEIVVTLNASRAKMESYSYKSSSSNYQDVTFSQIVYHTKTPVVAEVRASYPAVAKVAVAKLANKTRGTKLRDGRYIDEKIPAIYFPNEEVDFTITVTNTGNTLLENISLEDSPEDRLKAYFKGGKFALSFEQELETQKGKKIKVLGVGEDTCILDRLEPGDSFDVHFLGQMESQDKFKTEDNLNNDVAVKATYHVGEEGRDVEEDEDDKDSDKLHLRYAEVSISKLANKTTGVDLVDYRYQGKKEAGLYEGGEKVDYKILIANTGALPLKDVDVKEVMAKESKDYIENGKLTLQEASQGQVISKKKDTISIVKSDESGFTLDHLNPQDVVELHYVGEIKAEVEAEVELKNEVFVRGKYLRDGGFVELEENEKMKDEDWIRIKKKTKTTITKKTETKERPISQKKVTESVKTADTSLFFVYLSLGILSGLSLIATAALTKRG